MVDFGSDVSWLPDLDPNLSLVSGNQCLAEAIYRRLMTPKGSYAWDPEYGLYIGGLLNESLTPTTIAAWQRQIATEVEKDERVTSCVATLTVTSLTSLTLTLTATTSNGPFQMVLAVGDVTAAILSVSP